jgi:hypothetical protein
MTWVVAASTVFGYGALYSDVQVTFRDGSTRDILQKAYTVANFIAAGFAGSVKIGFTLLESATEHLTLRDRPPDSYAWHPVGAAFSWAPVARSLFAASQPDEQRLESRLLFVGASPSERQGLGAKIYFVRFVSPSFEPQIMSRAIKMCGIGTGAAVSEYKHSIKPLFKLSSGLLRAEVGRAGGWGNQLGHSISHRLGRAPHFGISRHLNTILVTQEGFRFGKTDQTTHYPDGRIVEHKMPLVARSYNEFLALASAAGSEGAEAIC